MALSVTTADNQQVTLATEVLSNTNLATVHHENPTQRDALVASINAVSATVNSTSTNIVSGVLSVNTSVTAVKTSVDNASANIVSAIVTALGSGANTANTNVGVLKLMYQYQSAPGSAYVDQSVLLTANQAAGNAVILAANTSRRSLMINPPSDCALRVTPSGNGVSNTAGWPLFAGVPNTITGAEVPTGTIYLTGLSTNNLVVIWEG